MTILATTIALKYCALAILVCLVGNLGARDLWKRTDRDSLLEWIVGWYVKGSYAGLVVSLAALPLLAIANLLRVWGVL